MLRVLHIDDSEMEHQLIRAMCHRFVNRLGALDWMNDGDAALVAMRENRYDAYLLDYDLGNRNGIDVLKAAIKGGCTAPIILLTGLRNRELDLEASSAGAADYLAKGDVDAEKLERSLRYSLQQARELASARRRQKEIEELVSHVSHELRTPLAATHQFITLLLDRIPGEINDEQERLLSRALANAEQLKRMIDDLMEVNRSILDKFRLTPAPADLAEIIRTTVEAFRGRAAGEHVTLHLDLRDPLPPMVIDGKRIAQILSNLIENALEYNRPGGSVTVRATRLGPDAAPAIDRVCLEVADTGCGIGPDALPRIFERMYQEPERCSASRRGLGLGLYICRELITRMGGRIDVSSRLGEGSTFTFTIPTTTMMSTSDDVDPKRDGPRDVMTENTQ